MLLIGVFPFNFDNPLLVLTTDQRVDIFAFFGFYLPQNTIFAFTFLFLLFDDFLPSPSSDKALTNFLPDVLDIFSLPVCKKDSGSFTHLH
jgi:hypothetical protein